MKDIKDYLHLYMGCEVWKQWTYKTSIITHQNIEVLLGSRIGIIKPYLRPLSDMTEEELKELYNFNYLYGNHAAPHEITKIVLKPNISGHLPNIIEISYSGKVGGTGYHSGQDILYLNKLSSEQHMYLLSKHFDLFQLIESGLAIDKTKT